MKCSICGYEFPVHDWERKLSVKDQAENSAKKVVDHYKRDHRDLCLFLTWLFEGIPDTADHQNPEQLKPE